MRSRTRLVTVCIALTLAGSNLLAPVAGAADAESDLCDTAPVAEINALTSLHFGDEEPKHNSMSGCTYRPEEGRHLVSFNVFEGDGFVGQAAIEVLRTEMAEAQDATEVHVGDYTGLTATIDGVLRLDLALDDDLLYVTASLPDSADGDGVDPEAFLIDVAEIVLSGMAAVEAASLAPPELSGIVWRGEQEAYGAELADPEGSLGALPWDALLDPLEAEFEQLGFYSVNAADEGSGELVGSYQAFRVEGAEEASLGTAFLAWLSVLAAPDELPTEETTVGGTDVLSITSPTGESAYIYVAGDTVHLISFPEAAAATVLEALE